jgi:hypothetical protein
MRGGMTMGIEFLPSHVQQQKNLPPSTLEERYVDMLKKEGIRRREIGFFRGCFSASCRMVDEVHSVCQELMLAYYYNPHLPLEMLESLHGHALSLQKAVDKYERVVLKMEDEWVNSWQADGQRIPG